MSEEALINERGAAIERRLAAIGIGRREFAEHASIDRTTLYRALSDDRFESISDKTWTKIERALDEVEDELGMAESGHMVTTTFEYAGVKVTMQGTPEDTAETLRAIVRDNSMGTVS